MLRTGDPFIWLTGGSLAVSLILVFGLVGLILFNGLGIFWPKDVARLTLAEGRPLLGEIVEREEIPDFERAKTDQPLYRLKVKQGNRDVYGNDFVWIDEEKIREREQPAGAVTFERLEWGNFYGFLKEIRYEGKPAVAGPEPSWEVLRNRLPEVLAVLKEIKVLEKKDVGLVSYEQEKIRLRIRKLNLQGTVEGAEIDLLNKQAETLQGEYRGLEERIGKLRNRMKEKVIITTVDGLEKELPISMIARAYRPNTMGVFEKSGMYLEKLWEFVSDDPRESNTEGGVFPAIFGTVMMVMIMSLVVTPFGVLAAFYLREYAKQGRMVSLVRIAVNNLAGVPSIVFGVFGVGFFIYFIGGSIDQIFFPERLPNPTYGTGGIFWASLTLALLTVPVVIVATEEGLTSIPNSFREASFSLGATKFETTWRVVLPAVLPAILTGVILAMARAAGEVAPLMITGVVKLAPSLPIDTLFPFFHLERKFMHLGFHIYDVGFQSPNVDASRAMVYTTTMLLLIIVLALNMGAITLRNHLKKKFAYSTF
jgi:phosphate transport system permease protein